MTHDPLDAVNTMNTNDPMTIRLEKVGPVDMMVRAPPSKSYTHRALLCGALAAGSSEISGVLEATDIFRTLECLRMLGIEWKREGDLVSIDGCAGEVPACGEVSLDCRDSGTTLRLLTTTGLLSSATVTVTGSRRMCERPIGPLVSSLKELGAEVSYEGKEGFPPFRICGNLNGGRCQIDPYLSSQFLSSLLLHLPCAREKTTVVCLNEPASASYLAITADVMRAFGVFFQQDGLEYVIEPQTYRAGSYHIEGDYSSASYLFALAAVCKGRVRVENLNPDSVQGDALFVLMLEEMGCRVRRFDNAVEVSSDGLLRGIDVNMSTCPDTVQTLAVVAAFAKTPSKIRGIEHLRHKESDRITAILRMLTDCGAGAVWEEGVLTITPSKNLHGCTIHPVKDHRTAMAGAVLGCGVGGVTVCDAACTAKSFPDFWEILRRHSLWNG